MTTVTEINFSEITPAIKKLKDVCIKNSTIEQNLYIEHKVNRGLRDINGKGVLAGLTEISEICSKEIIDGKEVPCDGKLFYRGIDIESLVSGFVKEKRFGFEEIAYLLILGELPNKEQLKDFKEDFLILVAPGCKVDYKKLGLNSEVAIMINFEKQIILIAGTGYSGEIKKSVFCVMNYLLPQKKIFTMHCSANMGIDGDTALFFGLSGTGKTTLSADPNRRLIGDDEHGWSRNTIFNFEGGCYAKCINLSKEHEPEIWNAIRFGAVTENVKLFEDTRIINFDDGSITENTRVGYPIDYIPNTVSSGVGPIPRTIFFLAADAFGVLPPISKLDRNAAIYHFVSGYTSKLAGTENGVTEPEATFSTCFGEPFFPLDTALYAQQFGRRVEKSGANVFLINTGWTGGSYGKGHRIPLKYTRAMINAALNGDLDFVEYVKEPFFNLKIPRSCPGVPAEMLNPKNTWSNKREYDKTAKKLTKMFQENFKKYDLPSTVVKAGPGIHK